MLAPTLAFGPLQPGAVARRALQLHNEGTEAPARWTLTLAEGAATQASTGGGPELAPCSVISVKPASGWLLPGRHTTVQVQYFGHLLP